MIQCAEAVKASLLASGCDKAEVMDTGGTRWCMEKIIDPANLPYLFMDIMMCSL